MSEPAERLPSLAGVAERLLKLLDTGSHLHPATASNIRAALDELMAYERGRRQVMLEAVRDDVAALDISKVPGGRTYKAMALRLAEVIDKRGDDDGPSTTAKLADQLTKVMGALTRKGGVDDDGFDDFQDGISTPVR